MNVPFFISIPTLASILNVAYKNIDQHLDFIEFFFNTLVISVTCFSIFKSLSIKI